jgi:hypothetical protein
MDNGYISPGAVEKPASHLIPGSEVECIEGIEAIIGTLIELLVSEYPLYDLPFGGQHIGQVGLYEPVRKGHSFQSPGGKAGGDLYHRVAVVQGVQCLVERDISALQVSQAAHGARSKPRQPGKKRKPFPAWLYRPCEFLHGGIYFACIGHIRVAGAHIRYQHGSGAYLFIVFRHERSRL